MQRRLLLLVDGVLLDRGHLPRHPPVPNVERAAPPATPEAAPAASSEAPASPRAAAKLQASAHGVCARRRAEPLQRDPDRDGARAAASRGAGRSGGGTACSAAPTSGHHPLPEGRGRAYLEDVQRRRVFAYSVGDVVSDARLEQIKTDRVVLRRGSETFEVLLYDPAKLRQSTAPAGVQSPETGAAGRPVIRRPVAKRGHQRDLDRRTASLQLRGRSADRLRGADVEVRR